MIEYKTQEMQMIPYKDRRKIEKKVLPEYYKGIRTHKKMFELRKDEDGIKPGDILVLREWDGEKYTGGMTRREVTAVLKDCPEYGLMDGYCILSLQTPGWDFVTPSAQPDVPDTNVGDMISRQAAIAVADSSDYVGLSVEDVKKVTDEVVKGLKQLPSAQPVWNNHTVACLLAEVFDDTCACNYNGIDEWLPEKCELLDSCPHPVGVACWEQFLKHKAERRTNGD